MLAHISGTIDWGEVIAALIGGLPAVGAWVRAEMIHGKIKTPSGDSIGQVVERTHALTAVGVAAATGVNGLEVDRAMARLNSDPGVTVPHNIETSIGSTPSVEAKANE